MDAATDVTLDAGRIARLDGAGASALGFSAALTSPPVRQTVFGGNRVSGWGERD